MDVYVSSALWVDGYIDDEFGPFYEWDGSIQEFHGWDEVAWVPIIVEEYFIGQVADALRKHIPFKQARGSSEGQSKHYYNQFIIG
jgi:hypothetical protein